MWFRKQDPVLSILVPFRSDHAERARNWRWLKKYYKNWLPQVEIVVGHDKWHWRKRPFSKTVAVNNAASRAKGEVFLILDADALLHHTSVIAALGKILQAKRRGEVLWLVPYRRLFRLTEGATKGLLFSDPTDPIVFDDPPHDNEIEGKEGSGHGHHFGAMAQMMPREAFFAAGQMDERFRNWGSEDRSFLMAVDTLYGIHKSTDNMILHLHHPKIGKSYRTRSWSAAAHNIDNEILGARYNRAHRMRGEMQELVNEWRAS